MRANTGETLQPRTLLGYGVAAFAFGGNSLHAPTRVKSLSRHKPPPLTVTEIYSTESIVRRKSPISSLKRD